MERWLVWPGRTHEDSVNVLLATGAVRLFAMNPYTPPFSRVGYGGNSDQVLREMWDAFDYIEP